MKQKNGGWIALFLAPACILFILIFAIPLVMVFVTSLFDYRLLPRTFTFVGFSNFVQLFTEDNRFWPIFGNTVKWLFIHCIFHVTLGTLLAFILYKKPRGWKFVRVTYMIPNIISQSAIAMIFLNLYNAQYGAVNSFLKLVGLESLQHNWLFETATAFPSVTLTWFLFAGYTTTLVLAQLLSTDESLIEAAELDGCNDLMTLVKVVIPLSVPILSAVTLFYFVSFWNRYTEAVMFINNSAKYTLQVMLRALVFQSDGSLGEGNIVYDNMKMAVMVLGMLPVLVIYPFVQKYFVSGLMLGGVKE